MKRLVPNAATPLTEDELARLETRHQPSVGAVWTECPMCETKWPCDASRLLAALRDTPVADTAEPDVPLFFEPCRDFDKPQSCYTNDGTGLWCDPCRERRRVALVADTAGIDAERLARALDVTLAKRDNGYISVYWIDRPKFVAALAAALRTPKPEGEPE